MFEEQFVKVYPQEESLALFPPLCKNTDRTGLPILPRKNIRLQWRGGLSGAAPDGKSSPAVSCHQRKPLGGRSA